MNKPHCIKHATQSLLLLPPGSKGTIIYVPDNPLIHLLGLRPGKVLQYQCRQIFGGPLLIKVGERKIALSRSLASKIIIAC